MNKAIYCRNCGISEKRKNLYSCSYGGSEANGEHDMVEVYYSSTYEKTELRIGNYFLKPGSDYPDGSKSIWIESGEGEGGQFPAMALEEVIEKFFNENF